MVSYKWNHPTPTIQQSARGSTGIVVIAEKPHGANTRRASDMDRHYSDGVLTARHAL
jgi:hypothetical protein